jgi:hypothetical protein
MIDSGIFERPPRSERQFMVLHCCGRVPSRGAARYVAPHPRLDSVAVLDRVANWPRDRENQKPYLRGIAKASASIGSGRVDGAAAARPSAARFARLIRTMSEANPLWGAPRIHGELLKLGFHASQATVAKYIVRRRTHPVEVVAHVFAKSCRADPRR